MQHAAAALAAPSAEVAAAAELLLSSCVDSAALAGLYSRLALCALRTRFESPQEARGSACTSPPLWSRFHGVILALRHTVTQILTYQIAPPLPPPQAAAVQKLLDLVVAGGAAAGRGVAGVAALEDVLHSACAALQGARGARVAQRTSGSGEPAEALCGRPVDPRSARLRTHAPPLRLQACRRRRRSSRRPSRSPRASRGRAPLARRRSQRTPGRSP